MTEALERLRATHPGLTVTGVAGDIATYEGSQALWSAATQACGPVDLWINNAGTSTAPVPLAQMSPTEIAATVATNLTGTMNGARVAIEGMFVQGHGQVSNVEGFGSSGSKRTGMSVYARRRPRCGISPAVS